MQMLSHNYEIKGQNYEIKSQNDDIISHNYDVKIMRWLKMVHAKP